jgi:hypothetical protein
MTKRIALSLGFAAAGWAAGCTFKAPDANKPLGCACDARPNAYAYCKYDACSFAGCQKGFFDLDGQPSNGCEASNSDLPGNLVVSLTNVAVTWFSEYSIVSFKGGGGIATASVSEPSCSPTLRNPCDVRLEAFQMWGLRNPSSDSDLTEALVAMSTPLAGTRTTIAVDFPQISGLSTSFAHAGARVPMLESTGEVILLVYPTVNGTVRLGVSGTFDGYVDNGKGTLQFSGYGFTPRLFDASVPDANQRDAAPDADASEDGMGDEIADSQN